MPRNLPYILRMYFLTVCLLLFQGVTTSGARASDRVALVIGNSDYAGMSLGNPVNDARDMSVALKTYGFSVITRLNADQRSMEEAVDGFYHRLQQAKVGLFYYAGHGMQIAGHNYLLPIGIKVSSAGDVKYRAVDAGLILSKMQDAGNRLNIVILDACRDNPFRSYIRSSRQGLAIMDAPDGVVVAYATAPGSVARDGKGRNGLYTSYLLKNMARPGFSIFQVFNRTGLDVKRATHGAQVPWITSSPMESFYLAGGGAVPQKTQVSPGAVQKVPRVEPRPASPQPPGRTFTDPSTGMEFVAVPGGCFQMGQSEEDKKQLLRDEGEKGYKKWFSSESPVHEVCVDGFSMGKYEVSLGQWRTFIRESNYRTDAERNVGKDGCWVPIDNDTKLVYKDGTSWKKPGFSQTENQPVACVSYNDVQEFIQWLNHTSGKSYRLPTEAEWEYAARGGTSTVRYWGDAVDSTACNYANVADKGHNWSHPFPCNDGHKYSSPVGSFKANHFGLYDMLGNVWEWTGDWYDAGYYKNSPRSNPTGPATGSYRVIRGGSWSCGPAGVRSASRNGDHPWVRNANMGFRLVLSPRTVR